jgi:hypothetical protein
MERDPAAADGKSGRAGPPRPAHFPAVWRCGWAANEKRKNSLRREKVKWADHGGSALPGILQLVGPILRIGDQARAHGIHPNVFCLLCGGFKIPQSMVENIALPFNSMLFCQLQFEVGDHLRHRLKAWKTEQCMKMIWHGKSEATGYVSMGFADGEGLCDGLPDFGRCELVGIARNAADRDEIDLTFGVGRIHGRAIMGKMFAPDVVHDSKR